MRELSHSISVDGIPQASRIGFKADLMLELTHSLETESA